MPVGQGWPVNNNNYSDFLQVTARMNPTFRFITAIVMAMPLLFAGLVQSQDINSLSPAQLSLLEQLSPAEREELLRGLMGENINPSQQQLLVPELLRRDQDDDLDEADLLEVPETIRLYDSEGNEILDQEGQSVSITTEILDEISARMNEASDYSDIPFFEQEIELEPFGYDLFEGVPTTFAPATDIPVPNEYRLGPGDTLDVQLFGKENRQYSLVVNRDGTINFPNIGPVNVMGQSFQELKQAILDRVAEELIGTSAAVTMGPLRSVSVVVVGDAKHPGSYTVSGLSTITNALLVSGGVGEVGSLRNIQLKRGGKVIARLDLYDLLLNGDARDDQRLESGDVIFIPPVGPTISVGGFVKRPAVYEIKREKTVADAVKLSGGLRPDAFQEGARIERIDGDWSRSFVDLDLTSGDDRKHKIKDGDVLLVPPVLRKFEDGVTLIGHVKRPGNFEWFEDMRLADLLQSLDVLKPQADLQYILIRRETDPAQRVQVLSANLALALANPGSAENQLLQARDQVYVFSLSDDLEDPFGRMTTTTTLLEELSRQANIDAPFERVTVTGEVRAPGVYPFEVGMRVSDLLRAGGTLTEAAYRDSSELTRYSVVGRKERTSELFKLDLNGVLAGDAEQDILLQPGDFLTVRRVQDWDDQMTVFLDGEVRYPGTYSFHQGETLLSVIERAGGLTEHAFPEGSLFLRETLREREQQQLGTLRERLRSDIASLSLQAATALEDTSVVEAQSVGTALLASLNDVDATGRLVIDLPALMSGESRTGDVLLQSGDQLLIPKKTQAVTVIGEVQFATSHLFDPGLKRNDYINRSGGLAPNASKKTIYVVRASGAVLANKGSVDIQPGDTVVVPLNTQRGLKLQAWSSITKIAYNAAIAVAAINGLN